MNAEVVDRRSDINHGLMKIIKKKKIQNENGSVRIL